VARGDEYLFGRDLLVAPVVEKGAASRSLYLPRGNWYDFWTHERHEGAREIERTVDLETMPLYVRAGTVLPTGPVRQYTSEPSDEPLTLTVFPGADAECFLYEDDGESFDFRKGQFMHIEMRWDDAARRLGLRLAASARMLRSPIVFDARMIGSSEGKRIEFRGSPVAVSL